MNINKIDTDFLYYDYGKVILFSNRHTSQPQAY